MLVQAVPLNSESNQGYYMLCKNSTSLSVAPTPVHACCWVLVCNCQELMWRGSDPLLVLRLLVLLSFVGNGLPKKHAGESGGRSGRQGN